jgi:hypothetical protein
MLLSYVAAEEARSITIQNDSGTKVEIYWINPSTGQGLLQSSPYIYNGAALNLNSFVTHTFEAREMPGKGGTCLGKDQTCRIGYFTVNKNDDQQVFIDSEFNVKHQDNKSIARESAAELLNDCEKQVQADTASEGWTAAEAISELKKCVASGVADEVEKANEEIAFQTQIRKAMAEHWENYTCADYDLATSDAVREEVWDHNGEFEVQVLLDRPASKIHVVKNFISEEECAAMEEQAKPKLHKATVADGKGGSELSPNRKAMQAGIRIPWSLEEEGHPLTTISRRVYDYTNHVLGMDIKEHGQEDLMSIQYEGRGEDDETPDRYMPHCDGDCNGMQHKIGNRMATMVMYCTVPEKGGSTNFRNSGVHVVPEAGTATFFSYIDPETMKMDNGFTEHSGCPVITGEKKIVTQWVRYGVDAENPWDSFNTLGIKISAEDD